MRRDLVLVAGMLASGVARAEPPTDTHYAIELYQGVAFGNAATTAMGGAAIANASGSSGTLANASAPAVRPTTDTAHWNWDYHLDWQTSSLSRDADNSGRTSSGEGGISAVTGGLAGRIGDWAAAITVTYEQAPLVGTMVPAQGGEVGIHATTTHSRIAVARYIPQIDLAVGAAIDVATFSVGPDCSGTGCDKLFDITGGGASAGATWMPGRESWRIGATGSTPSRGGTVDAQGCDPMDCNGFVLPDSVVSPWQVGAGVAYRIAPTPWNQLVGGYWRDEKAITLAADVAVIGASPNAYGLQAFGEHELQRAGRHVGVSPRGGVEYEALPGRLRVRAGSYWEPARFAEVAGRLHATFGLELRALEVNVWGLRRGRITLTGDIASRYNTVGLSVGFWH